MNKVLQKMKLAGVAAGVSLALASGPASALTWYYPNTVFEDDDIDFHYTVDNGQLVVDTDGTLDVGDVLISVLEIARTFDQNGTGTSNLAPAEELTGVAAIQIDTITPPDLLGLSGILFKPLDLGLNAVLALGDNPVTVTDGDAGDGAMVALWLDGTPDLTPNPPDCTTIGGCIDAATDGSLFEVDGFTATGNADNPGTLGLENWYGAWAASGAATDVTAVLTGGAATKFGSYNYAMDILENGTGRLLDNGLACPGPLLLAGLCGATDNFGVVGSGDVLGGAGLPQSLIDDGVVARSDFDFVKQPIPEPGALMLMGMGLAGFGFAQRRRRKA